MVMPDVISICCPASGPLTNLSQGIAILLWMDVVRLPVYVRERHYSLTHDAGNHARTTDSGLRERSQADDDPD